MRSGNVLFRLVYASRNRMTELKLDHEAEMTRILLASRRNNARMDVTGAFLFSADCFAQALEGDIGAVMALFDRIKLDRRHSDPVILQSGRVGQRQFGGWSMAYAGRLEAERLRFAAVTGRDRESGECQVMGLLRGAVA